MPEELHRYKFAPHRPSCEAPEAMNEADYAVELDEYLLLGIEIRHPDLSERCRVMLHVIDDFKKLGRGDVYRPMEAVLRTHKREFFEAGACIYCGGEVEKVSEQQEHGEKIVNHRCQSCGEEV